MHLCFNLNENGSFLHWSGCRRAYNACVRWIMSKIALRWPRGYELLKKSLYLYFLCIQKVFSSLHKIQIEPPMADGFHWRCLSFFSGPQQCYLHGSQMESHKPSGFYLKYLKLCSEDEQSFYVVGTACGLVNNDKMIILGWSIPLSRWVIFIAIAQNTLYGSTLSIFLLCPKSLGY